MAYIAHKTKTFGRINTVFTPKEHRGLGYASNIVGHLTQLLLSEGIRPILYTDYSNDISNHVYKNIGFEECGRIHQLDFIPLNKNK